MPNLPNAPRKYVFVFGSNEAGIHGAGAAKTAQQEYGAVFGACYGHYGNSFAIPTKDEYFKVLPVDTIGLYVMGFRAYAMGKRKVNFKVTTIGTGLSGIPHERIAPLFVGSPENCWFDTAWRPWLGAFANYWGTYP